MITITLEGESWRDILREMSIIEASVRGSRIEAKPEQTDIAKEERSGQDGPKTPSCPVCGKQVNEFDYNEHKWVAMDRKEYCSVTCSIAGRNMTERRATAPEEPKKPVCEYCGCPLDQDEYISYGVRFCSKACSDRYDHSHTNVARIYDLPEQTDIAKDCQKCHSESLAELASILKGGYGLGPDEVYDILERVR